MMNLAEYRDKNARLADFLPWAALIGPGIVLNKDGSFQRTARFRGPDLDSAVPAELVAVAGRLNNAFRRLGSDWAIFVEAQRHPASIYPASTFPDPASALVDAERALRVCFAQWPGGQEDPPQNGEEMGDDQEDKHTAGDGRIQFPDAVPDMAGGPSAADGVDVVYVHGLSSSSKISRSARSKRFLFAGRKV